MKSLFAHKWLSILFGLILFSADVFPQRVGLVLSGGGAKGLTHIGIIRALEENNIPIDYITGTSMGAIVGSLYAMGYSPDDMEQLIRSDDFKRWYSGQIEDKYVFYLRNHEPTPDFFNINLSFKDSASIKTQFIPTSVVNPIQMNIAFMKLYAEATAQCKGDFDELFVPFRCVASDVYHKRELVLGNGDLGNAVRASMTFPFMFKPIELDSVLVYDGGIYNNFPADVMMETFKPDVIIGSVVASNPARPDENDMIGQVENMIMQKTDYSLPDSVGILMTFKYNDINLMDFDKIDRLVKIGYDRTMSLMDSIKMKVDRRMSEDVLNLRRDMYKSRLPELRFKKIYIEGVNAQQSRYIRNEISKNEDETFSYDDFVRSYFRLLSGSSISEIIPQAVYNPDEGVYDLRLKVKVEAPLSVKIGGSVSSSTSNQIYFGVSYRDLNYYSKEIIFDGQLGKVYNNLQLSGRLDLTTKLPISIKFIAGLSSFDYFRKDKLFSLKDSPSFTKKEERFAKVKVALPFLSNKKAEVGVGVAQHVNQYYQSNIVDIDKREMDKSVYFLYGGSLYFGGNTLNKKQFATSGYRESLIAQVILGNERFKPFLKEIDDPEYKEKSAWLQISYKNETYFKLRPRFTLGSYVEGYYSSRNFSENYTATMLEAGEFAPNELCRYTYNEYFRANQYVACGLRPIYEINNMFQVRGEVYGFLPIFPIERGNMNKAVYGDAFSRLEYMGQLSVVCTFPFAAVSVYANYFSSPAKNWNFGLTLGWQLFNSSFIE